MHIRLPRVYGAWAVVLWLSGPAAAQPLQPLSSDDANAIQALVTAYARALGSCAAEEFADLFAPDTGYFASGIRGQIAGRDRLVALVQSERHCTAPAGGAPAARPGGAGGPTVTLQATSAGARGVADLGGAGEYQDEYVKTPKGWRFASRTVIIPAERAAGLDAGAMLAIRRLSRDRDLGDYYVADQNGVRRFRTSGVEIAIANGVVTGHAFLKDGTRYDDVYEKTAAGEWRITSRVHVPAGQ